MSSGKSRVYFTAYRDSLFLYYDGRTVRFASDEVSAAARELRMLLDDGRHRCAAEDLETVARALAAYGMDWLDPASYGWHAAAEGGENSRG